MPPIAAIAARVFIWLVTHRDQIKSLILGVEDLMADAPGATKAAAVRNFIARAMEEEGAIEADVQKAWPFIGGFFDGFVAKVKKAAAAPATAAAA